MKLKLLSIAAILLMPLVSQATRVAVTDSGTDFSHQWLVNHVLINEKEIPGNYVDDDHNGKVDDIVGWNFVEDYGKVFFPQHLLSMDPRTFTFFEVIARAQAGTQTPADEKFLKENVKDLTPDQKAALLAKLNFYGEYAHSTHVSGIIATLSPQSKIMSNRVFPDTPPDFDRGPKKGIVDMVYKLIATVTNGTFAKVADYLKEREIDVANYSLGVGLVSIAKASLGIQGNKNPTPEQIQAETNRLWAQYEPAGRAWMNASPGTLFVIAAGNDDSDNDKLPAFPANVRTDNAITVAATLGTVSLASFSNYGETTVDIAAPGVAILSSVPSLDHKQILPMSGTSMAAPYITGVAAAAKEINPKLTPLELKQIMMGTVDHKEWLKGKVVSQGVVNPARVMAAAEKAKTGSIAEAISFSRVHIVDQPNQGVPVSTRSMPASLELKNFARQLVF